MGIEAVGKELYKAARQTKWTEQKIKNYLNLPSVIEKLKNQIRKKNYLPGKYTCFAVSDPVLRRVKFWRPHTRIELYIAGW